VNIIEQAARRLEELRRSGIEVPAPARPAAGNAARLPKQPRQASAPPADPAKTVEIDLRRLTAQGYVTPDNPRTQIASEFRVIKRPILNNVHNRSAAPVERANLIMVTSSVPGEGKTFVSVNLAISLAMELDCTVLLVDADVSRPSVLPRLGLAPAPGLLDVLSGSCANVGDVILRTNVDKLSVLPAGTPSGHATEMLASEQMNQLLVELASRYSDRVLVFDAPPLLPSTESRVLATHMGQVIVVVEAERTPCHTVASTMAVLEACPVVLPLLNKTTRTEVGTYYGYYEPPAEGKA
jgi:protein-tyrosine kinase